MWLRTSNDNLVTSNDNLVIILCLAAWTGWIKKEGTKSTESEEGWGIIWLALVKCCLQSTKSKPPTCTHIILHNIWRCGRIWFSDEWQIVLEEHLFFTQRMIGPTRPSTDAGRWRERWTTKSLKEVVRHTLPPQEGLAGSYSYFLTTALFPLFQAYRQTPPFNTCTQIRVQGYCVLRASHSIVLLSRHPDRFYHANKRDHDLTYCLIYCYRTRKQKGTKAIKSYECSILRVLYPFTLI
jgi:hypothetical protein